MSSYRPDPDQPPTYNQDYATRSYQQLPRGYTEGGWTDGQPPPGWTPPGWTPPKPRKRRHIFRWVFLAVQAIFLIWIITGASSSAGTPKSCAGMVGQALKTCQDAGHAGTAIGVFLIVMVWACVDVVLALSWLIFRRRS